MEEEEIPKELPVRRIPVRIDKATVIFVPEGANIEAHVKKYKEHKYSGGGNLPWD